jgi:phosphoribosyl 1,2-cyclic phosphate phosphodiesterase
MKMKAVVKFFGTGTSIGTPMIGCNCGTCQSDNPKNHRCRAGAAIYLENGKVILLDAPVDLRAQALKYKLSRVDAVLITHHHADHIFGLDELRVYNYHQKDEIPVFIPKNSYREMKRIFNYIFKFRKKNAGIPGLNFIKIDSKRFEIVGVKIIPIVVNHGDLRIFGYRIGDMAYLTDVSGIPSSSMKHLADLKVLILSALRYEPHIKHLSIDQAVDLANQIKAKKTFLTHMSHTVEYNRLADELPIGITPAYDGLEIDFEV